MDKQVSASDQNVLPSEMNTATTTAPWLSSANQRLLDRSKGVFSPPADADQPKAPNSSVVTKKAMGKPSAADPTNNPKSLTVVIGSQVAPARLQDIEAATLAGDGLIGPVPLRCRR
ncbi:MAG: hypothetical protein M0Z94_12890 [Dehalococcoidales bacterium]|nr:hypothetical protein [Dehalococcoidales bacterium]